MFFIVINNVSIFSWFRRERPKQSMGLCVCKSVDGWKHGENCICIYSKYIVQTQSLVPKTVGSDK